LKSVFANARLVHPLSYIFESMSLSRILNVSESYLKYFSYIFKYLVSEGPLKLMSFIFFCLTFPSMETMGYERETLRTAMYYLRVGLPNLIDSFEVIRHIPTISVSHVDGRSSIISPIDARGYNSIMGYPWGCTRSSSC